MKVQAAYLQSIHKALPDLNVDYVELNAQGQNSDVVVVNGELIFRFPKYPHVLERLKTETAILQSIQGNVTLAVPAPLSIHLEQGSVGEAFVGYRSIPGEPLWPEALRMMDSQEGTERVAHQLGTFLKALHGMAVEEPLRSELPVHDTVDTCAGIYARMREKVFAHMRSDARHWATGHFESFLDDRSNFEYEPVLKHGDFGPSNILFDRETRRVTGIIDFGNSGLGDPAYDLAGLLSGYGQEFVECCSDAYPEVRAFMGRIRFYQGTFALLEALFGAEDGDEEAFKAGLARYV